MELAGGGGLSGECSESLSRSFRGQSPPRKLLCSKEQLDWLKADLNVVEIIIVQDYTQKINVNENTHVHTVLKLRDKQATSGSKI